MNEIIVLFFTINVLFCNVIYMNTVVFRCHGVLIFKLRPHFYQIILTLKQSLVFTSVLGIYRHTLNHILIQSLNRYDLDFIHNMLSVLVGAFLLIIFQMPDNEAYFQTYQQYFDSIANESVTKVGNIVLVKRCNVGILVKGRCRIIF